MFSNRNAIAAAALVLVVGAGALALSRLAPVDPAGTASPSRAATSSSIASPSPTLLVGSSAYAASLDATFRSTTHNYRVDYPSSWTVHAGVGLSRIETLDCYPPGCADPYVDFATFSGQAFVPDGVTPDEWVAANKVATCPSVLGTDTVTIDGHQAFITAGGCLLGGLGRRYAFKAILAVGNVVYTFELISSEQVDRRFLPMLATIHLYGPGSPP